jgi:hypothetical protein
MISRILRVHRKSDVLRFALLIPHPNCGNTLKKMELFRRDFPKINERVIRSIEIIEQNNNITSDIGIIKFGHCILPGRQLEKSIEYLPLIDNFREDLSTDSQSKNVRIIIDFSNSKNWTSSNTITLALEPISHLLGLSFSNPEGDLASSHSQFDQIFYCSERENISEKLLNVIHDIALDIYFFHYFILRSDCIALDNTELKEFSREKLRFATTNQLSYSDPSISGYGNSYFCFASSCRDTSNYFNYEKYYKIWCSFENQFRYKYQSSVLSVNYLQDFILNLVRFGGQISRRNLQKSLQRLQSNNYIFVIAFSRPKNIDKRRTVAALFGKTKWKQNMWCIISNSGDNIIRYESLLPYIRFMYFNFQ